MTTVQRLWVLCFVLMCQSGLAFAQPGSFWQNPLPQGNHLTGASVVDTNTVIAVGSAGTVMKTTDGGATWAVRGL